MAIICGHVAPGDLITADFMNCLVDKIEALEKRMQELEGSQVTLDLEGSQVAPDRSGKIAGKVVDGATNTPLAGANVIVEGTSMGAVSALDGSFAIMNVPPGSYRVRAYIVGYTTSTLADVDVNPGQTTELKFHLSSS